MIRELPSLYSLLISNVEKGFHPSEKSLTSDSGTVRWFFYPAKNWILGVIPVKIGILNSYLLKFC
ncbi:hypothetical protein AM228_01120 [Planktothricoides sp. SR001]|nr:hypothetical protein AM228_01120 [Planktothricoides sp. SR001]